MAILLVKIYACPVSRLTQNALSPSLPTPFQHLPAVELHDGNDYASTSLLIP
jgi:hypothetical protein